MSKLNQEELLKIMGDSIEEGRRNIRDLKGSLDISQDEFDERFYKLNLAEQQMREMIQKPDCSHVRKIYRKIGSDGLDAACNEIGVEYLYCQDCGEYFDYITLKQVAIPRPKITEEWIDEKARQLAEMIEMWIPRSMDDIRHGLLKGFIHSLVKEIRK